MSDQPRCFGGLTSCAGETRSRHTDYRYYPTGDVQQITRASGDATAQLQTTFVRDGYGNIFQVTEIDGSGDTRFASSMFDDRGMFPVSMTNGLGQTTQVRYDDRFGKLAVSVDPNNISDIWSYDDFGVLRDHQGPTGEETTDYALDSVTTSVGLVVSAKYSVTRQRVGSGTATERFNSLGQLVARENSGFNGTTVVEELGYDLRDRLSVRSRPHLPNDSTQGVVLFQYDNLNRVTDQILPNDTLIHQDYSLVSALSSEISALLPSTGGVITIVRTTDPNNNKTYQFADRDGHRIQAIDANNHATSYAYGAFGTLEQIEGPNGTLSYNYDNFSRLLSSTDAAVGGQMTLTYDGLDEVVTMQDPAHRQSKLSYDELGRQTQLDNADGTSIWTYDQGTNGIGRISSDIGPTGQMTEYAYEPPTGSGNRGLPISVTHSVVPIGLNVSTAPMDLTVAYHYDQFARLAQVDYPTDGVTALSIKYGFDAAGNVISASNANDSAAPYWQVTGADQGYRIAEETLGNGIVTERRYEPQTGHLSSIISKYNDSVVQQLTYGYDPNGNLTQRADAISGMGEIFGYDALNRVSSTTYSNGLPAEAIKYDPTSNAISHQDHVGDYTYFPEGRDWLETAGDNQYTHDAFGNIQTRTGPSVPGGTQELTYTTFNLPSHISTQSDPAGDVDLAYGADETRVVKQTSSAITYYAGDLYQRIVTAAGDTTHRFMIYGGGRAIAAVTAAGGSTPATIEYLHDDSLGSIQAITASDATVLNVRHFDAFGDARGSLTDASPMPYGYTGEEQDAELGLVNMHGRLYDSTVGQFMSPDPVVQAPFSQGLNRFAYAFNSPLNLTDPSGFSADAGEDAAIGIGVAYFTGLAATLLNSGGESGAAVEGGASAANAASAATSGATAATAGASASTGAIVQAVGVGLGYGTSIFSNVILSGRQAVSAIAPLSPVTRSATSAGTGPAPLSRTSYGSMATAPVQEGSAFGQGDGHNAARCGGSGQPVCGARKFGSDPMDQVVFDFLNAQSQAPEYPGTVADTITNPNAPEHAASIIQDAHGHLRLGPIAVSYIDTSMVFLKPPQLDPGERWVGVIHDHPSLPSDVLAQSEGHDLPGARNIRASAQGRNFRSSYVVGPSGQGPYLGVIVFQPSPSPGALVTLGISR